jgi:hypothetical protein
MGVVTVMGRVTQAPARSKTRSWFDPKHFSDGETLFNEASGTRRKNLAARGQDSQLVRTKHWVGAT